MSPAVDPAKDSTVLNIRKRLKGTRRDEGFLIPSGPEPELFLCAYLPKVMPRGIQLTVRARVNWLSPAKAEVTIREVINPLKEDFISRLPPGKMNLLRTGMHRRPASGHRLQEAMDTKCDLLLVVTVALNWVSGEPLYRELVSFANDEMDGSREIDHPKPQFAMSQHPVNPSSPTEKCPPNDPRRRIRSDIAQGDFLSRSEVHLHQIRRRDFNGLGRGRKTIWWQKPNANGCVANG
ncbi:MAG TPA: hypothetical protein VIM63_14465 [Rhodoferax sp.]